MTYININTLVVSAATLSNRDDAGQQKTCVYGGVQRARESSQSNTRAARDLMRQAGVVGGVSTSTTTYAQMLAQMFIEADVPEDEAEELATMLFADLIGTSAAGIRATKAAATARARLEELVLDIGAGAAIGDEAMDYTGLATPLTKEAIKKLDGAHRGWVKAEADAVKNGALFRLSPGQYQGLFEVGMELRAGTLAKKPAAKAKVYTGRLHAALTGALSLDQAAFGRMFASNKSLSIEAAVQTAHSIGVNKMVADWDFFTAMDDERGVAALMDVSNLTSPIFYKYRSIHLETLRENLSAGLEEPVSDEVLEQAVRDLTMALVTAAPKSASSAHGPQSRPATVYLSVTDAPTTLVGAFVEPVETVTQASEAMVVLGERLGAGYGGVHTEALWQVEGPTTVDSVAGAVEQVAQRAVVEVTR